MTINDTDIRLLRENPEKLLIRYQPLIRLIVKNLSYQGYLPRREISDLTQDVNRKLVERLPRIRTQYNGKSRFRTYFSVVIRNLCLEEFRKVRLVAEPQAEPYENMQQEVSAEPMLIRQEYERLHRAVRLFGREEPAIWIALRCFSDLPVKGDQLVGFDRDPGLEVRDQLAVLLNDTLQQQKKEKLEALSQVFSQLDNKARNAEAVRKWSAGRIEEVITLMNGKPPVSAYTADILYILIEKSEYVENNAGDFSIQR
jgi:RNA polymerase sigma factor (sigma-70 family)